MWPWPVESVSFPLFAEFIFKKRIGLSAKMLASYELSALETFEAVLVVTLAVTATVIPGVAFAIFAEIDDD